MSVYVTSHVWKNGPDDRSELLVLLALADFADDDGHCWPSMKSLAEKARLSSDRAAQKIVRRLEEKGYVNTSTGGGRHGCNAYVVALETPSRGSPRPKDAPVPEATKPRPEVPETPSRGSPEPSRTIKEPSKKKDAREILCSVLSESAADDYIAHRKAKRATLTSRAAELIAQKLSGHPDPDAVIAISIMNGWTGVFPDKGASNGKPHKPNLETLTSLAAEHARRMDCGPDSDPSESLLSAGQPAGIAGSSSG